MSRAENNVIQTSEPIDGIPGFTAVSEIIVIVIIIVTILAANSLATLLGGPATTPFGLFGTITVTIAIVFVWLVWTPDAKISIVAAALRFLTTAPFWISAAVKIILPGGRNLFRGANIVPGKSWAKDDVISCCRY